MNEFGEKPGEEYANWKAPDTESEETQENMEVQPFEIPEIPDGGSEYKSEESETKTVEHIIKDADGRKIFERQTSPDGDWQHKKERDEHGRVVSIEHQSLAPGQESHTLEKLEHNDEGEVTRTGRIEFGQDSGHEYKVLPSVKKDLGDGRVIETTTTEIIEQGKNGSGKRAETGTKFTSERYREDGDWIGEKVTGTDGTESTQFPKHTGIEELPNWK